MDLKIAGRWALVCGASKGLGFGCANSLAREGVNLVIVARTPAPLEEAASKLRAYGNQVLTLAADITTEEGRAAALDVKGGPGKDYDILVTNAGGPPPGDFRDWGEADWLAAVQANMLTPIALIRAVVDGMAARNFGRVVNITSVAVKAPIAQLGLSNGARSGLTGFIAGLARSGIARHNVTINNLLPGAFDTDRLHSTIQAQARASSMDLAAVTDARRNGIPAGRFGTPEEFGDYCAFLCSALAGYVTGQNILADGGAYPGTY
ncbi:SDR family oxidoreductase [Alcaligenaceae bacterium]|nr:SDR family oxidoreductase [Alcaligenaceae bacterium]